MEHGDEVARAFSLDGKVAVITGAGSGLGRETARIFALAGAEVVLADIDLAGLAGSWTVWLTGPVTSPEHPPSGSTARAFPTSAVFAIRTPIAQRSSPSV